MFTPVAEQGQMLRLLWLQARVDSHPSPSSQGAPMKRRTAEEWAFAFCPAFCSSGIWRLCYWRRHENPKGCVHLKRDVLRPVRRILKAKSKGGRKQ